MARAAPNKAISRVELVALLAMLVGTVAFSIDAMLPVLPEIANAISPDAPNRVQLVIASFVVGMGLGTFVSGPLSDAFGRRTVAVGGAAIYCAAALVAAVTYDIETMLMARAIQGMGAAGPRVMALAIARDLFSGREMARVVSLVMMVFSLVPVFAPTIGAAIAHGFGWRAIFLSFALFSLVSTVWLWTRQPETLAPQNRRPFRPKALWNSAGEVAGHTQVRRATAVLTLVYAMLFMSLMSSQTIFQQTFGRGDSFAFWFGVIAAVSATASLLNAAVVVRLGMRAMVRWALFGQLMLTTVFLTAWMTQVLPPALAFPAYLVWQTSVFYMAGLGIGNLNALALEPMGHIAGMASSIISAVATVTGVLLAIPVSLAFDGTPAPLTLGVLVVSALALYLIGTITDSSHTQTEGTQNANPPPENP
jgi:DHA1 family bicyclomycin/chloramphenicol resistance-like MFS transporter